MLRTLTSLMLAGVVFTATAGAQTLEITRELGTPEHNYSDFPPFFTTAADAIPFPAAPNFQFAISDYDIVRLRLTAPPNMKYVVSRAVSFGWAGDLNFVPTNSNNSGPLHPCTASCSFTVVGGTAPLSTIEGFKTDDDWLKIRATATSPTSADFEFTEIVLEWNVSAFSGSSRAYTMFDGGGWINGPEMIFHQSLTPGSPDPGQAVSLQPIVQPCFTDVAAGLPGVVGLTSFARSVAWGDYDNDGDMDILLSMSNPSPGSSPTRVYRSSGGATPTFSDAGAVLTGGTFSGTAAWGDYDNDADLDIVIAGGPTKLYRNNGGTNPTFTDTGFVLPTVSFGGAAWGDYDNDGDLDIVLTGFVCRNSGGANPTFTSDAAGLTEVGFSSLDLGDFDNDGDLDVLLAGTVYRNSGGPNPTFSDIGAGLAEVQHGAWGDYDNDGDLDIVVTGNDVTGRVSKLYRNGGGPNPTFSEVAAGLLAVEAGGVAWGDYDNDGYLDLLLAGYVGTGNVSKLYRNGGGPNPTFSEVAAGLAGVSNGSVAWGDHDSDGDLDIVLAGNNGVNYISRVYRNDCAVVANTPPSSPMTLSATLDGAVATFSWSEAMDAQTPSPGLHYNLRVGTSPGAGNIVGPMASTATGSRLVPEPGNTNQNTSWNVRLPAPGTYYWSVQAVDAAFTASVFANEATLTLPQCFADIGASLAAPNGTSTWGDYDNDGDLDILMNNLLYLNDGGANPTFSGIAVGLPSIERAAGGDYDNDGDLDILLPGSVYRNSGGANPTFSDIGAGLVGVHYSALAWGDYDNDDDLDILLTGEDNSSFSVSKLYRNSGGANPTFSDAGAGLHAVQQGSVAWGDYDNDDDLDILLTGVDNTGVRISKIYRNNGGANPTFTDIGAGLVGVNGSSVAWGDYDNDGDLDILLTGESAMGRVARVYRSSGGATSTFTDINAALPGLAGGSVAFADYDKDGDLDILLAGNDGLVGISILLRNSGGANPTFSDGGGFLSGVQLFPSVAWGDYDNDSDLDILLTGFVINPPSPISKVYRNLCAPQTPKPGPGIASAILDGPNTPPTPPGNLYGRIDGTVGRFSWTASTDAQTPSHGLSYNLRIGTSPGACDILSPMTNAATGYRRLPSLLGNVNQTTTWEIVLPGPGTYYWSVQAVDGSSAGSAFAIEETPVSIGEEDAGPQTYALESAGPNPFSNATTIQLRQPVGGRVSLVIYNLAGRKVRVLVDESLRAGTTIRAWDGKDDAGQMVPSGIYFVRMQAAGFERMHKVTVIR